MTVSGQIAERMRAKLIAGFAPAALDSEDDSARHAGHAGAREGGETHFKLEFRERTKQ